MALLASAVYGHIRHALAGEPAAEMSVRQIANSAGEWLTSAHPWRWLDRPPVRLDLRGTITVDDATWTTATKTLTLASAFTNYTFLEGDQILVTDGTGATLDYFDVASKTSANAIVLVQDIGSANGTADIDFTMDLPACALPSDLATIVCVKPSAREWNGAYPATIQEIVDMRSSESTAADGLFYYALASAQDPSGMGAPTYRLEVFPTPTTNSSNHFTIAYRAGWTPLSDDDDAVSVPSWVEPLYLQAARAFALGWEEADKMDLDQRLILLRGGMLWKSACDRDGFSQANYGEMRGGAASGYGRPIGALANDFVFEAP